MSEVALYQIIFKYVKLSRTFTIFPLPFALGLQGSTDLSPQLASF